MGRKKKEVELTWEVVSGKTKIHALWCSYCGKKFTLTLKERRLDGAISTNIKCPYCKISLDTFYDFDIDEGMTLCENDKDVTVNELTTHERKVLVRIFLAEYKKDLARLQSEELPGKGDAFNVHALKNICDKLVDAVETVDNRMERAESFRAAAHKTELAAYKLRLKDASCEVV